MMLNNPTQRVELIEHFSTSKQIMFDYTGAFDVSQVLATVIQGKNADATAARAEFSKAWARSDAVIRSSRF